ncbi:hsp70-binding protein 1-like [Artemia franciscana]|uniref:hsp70-binding protein 1-like n=1 Tax=Artemia franciscana TaxID=6661 RepID=UPI0032DACBFC
MDNQERPPFRDMQGLLNFALRETAREDAEGQEALPMDPERRIWLEDALRNLSVDLVHELKRSLQLLNSDKCLDSNELPGEYEDALDSITDTVGSIDLANDFQKIGGLTLIPKCLDSPHPGIRWRTGHLISTLTQNNPYCQKQVVRANLVPTLLKMIEEDSDETVRVRCFSAISSIARGCQEAQQELAKHDGFSVFLRTLQSNSEKLKTKAAFLLTALCRDNLEFRDTLCKMGLAEQIIGLLYTDRDSTHEHLLSALLSLVRDHNPARIECQRTNLGLRKILVDKIEECKGQESLKEEEEYCKEILDLCFGDDLVEDR